MLDSSPPVRRRAPELPSALSPSASNGAGGSSICADFPTAAQTRTHMSEDEVDVLDDLREQVGALQEEVRALRSEEDPERLLTKEEAAELLSVSERTVDTMIHSGEITSLKIGRARRIPRRALMSYIRAKTNGTDVVHS